MKLNWGHRLVFFTILFMVFIILMVVAISRQKVDLVDQNYYEKGIRYQEEINKYSFDDSIAQSITFDMAQRVLSFKMNIADVGGNMIFYRPSDSGLDFAVPFNLDEKGEFNYSTSSLKPGNWKVIFEWTLNGQKMASEKQIVIQ
jgi:hypothetical protein